MHPPSDRVTNVTTDRQHQERTSITPEARSVEPLNFSALTQNMNSIGTILSDSKMSVKCSAILNQNADVIFVQDLRLNTNKNQNREDKFRDTLLKNNSSRKPIQCFLHSPNSARGVGIIINSNHVLNATVVHKDDIGNAIIVRATLRWGLTYLVCVYGPNSNDIKFYRMLEQKLSELRGQQPGRIIAGGNWNCVS